MGNQPCRQIAKHTLSPTRWHGDTDEGSGEMEMTPLQQLDINSGLRLSLTAGLLAMMANVAVHVPAARAATTFNVNTTADGTDASPGNGVCETASGNGICTLRAAIEEANANTLGTHDTINVPAGTYVLSVGSNVPPDGTTDLDIRESLTIVGAGAGTTIIDGGGPGKDRVFEIAPFGDHIPQVNISGVTIRNGATGKGGGGIYNYGCIVNISDSTISGNSATFGGGASNNGNGGGIYNSGGTLNIVDTTLSGNQARGVVVTAVGGGGIYNTGGGSVIATNSAFLSNQVTTIAGSGAAANGGGIYNEGGGTVTISHSTFTGNTVTGIGGTVGDGGGIYNTGGAVTINEDSTFSNNHADFKGGGIYNNGGGAVIIKNAVIGGSSNTAQFGAGICNDGGQLTIVHSSISDNLANPSLGSAYGGGIYNMGGGVVDIANSTLSDNVAAGSIGFGGGIYNTSGGSQVNIAGSTISGNFANGSSGYGGGIFNTSGGSINIERSTISRNQTNKTGGSALAGGIYNLGGSSVTTITNSTVSTNRAGDSGGGIYNSNGTLVMNYVTITGNTADFDSDGSGDGGGIYRSGGPVNLENTILGNNSDNSAGTKHPDCSGTITSQDYNLVGNNTGCSFTAQAHDQVGTSISPIDPILGPLADNGGPTFTHALGSGSPAVNKGTCTGPATDQRGWLRPDSVTHLCDVGAYEYGSGIPYYLPVVLKGAGP